VSRVVLSGDDVDALRRVAPFASTDSEARTSLTLVYVRDGLAYASDSYRLAFTEVDCDDLTIPARCVEWLPVDGTTVTVRQQYASTLVTWDEDGVEVGGGYPTDSRFLELASVLTLVGKRPDGTSDGFRCDLSEAPYFKCERDFYAGKPLALIGAAQGPMMWVNRDFLATVLKPLGDEPRVHLPNQPTKPVWFWDDDVTVILMPLRVIADVRVGVA